MADSDSVWVFAADGKRQGPYTAAEIGTLISKDRLSPGTLVWKVGMADWVPASDVLEISKYCAPPLPEPHGKHFENGTSRLTSTGKPVVPARARVDDRAELSGILAHVSGPKVPGSPRSPMTESGKVPAPPAKAGRQPGSYFRRHWSGDLSLGVSYWVNGVLANLASWALGILGIRVFSIALFDGGIEGPTPLVAWWLLVGLWTTVILVTVWQLVGVWNSAGKHLGRGGSSFWAAMARVGVVLGGVATAGQVVTVFIPQLSEMTQIAFTGDPLGEYRVALGPGGSTVEVAGPLTHGVTEAVQEILDANPQAKVVRFNSTGGRVPEGRRLHDLLRARSLVTYTETECHSACTLAFLGGSERLMTADAHLGFHQWGLVPGLDHADMEVQYAADKRRMIAAGVSADFADRAFATPDSGIWVPERVNTRETPRVEV